MNAPTLLVGLGGIGGQIIGRVADMVNEEDLKNISFVVIDTDSNDLEKLKNENSLIGLIQTSSNVRVGEYLSQDSHAKEEWFPVNRHMNHKVISEGAGQIRAISRLAADTLLHTGELEELNRAITRLFQVNEGQMDQALRILIISSLAGGTGSGLIVPIATYIQHYLEQNYSKSSNVVRGFFILPEIFYSAIKGENERNNLKTNAYATLRELDAFLMKGDHTLPDRYLDSVKIEFPRTSSSSTRIEYEEYDVRPYDYCFLFDSQNTDGKFLPSLNSYLDQAANVIYSLSIGPMNRRSNSSEDNTIPDLIREDGRNRYAGAGVSRLIYPYKDIKTYIALQWAKQCISDQWLEYDKSYLEKRKEDEQGARGQRKKPEELRSYYVKSVDSDKERHKEFAEIIYAGSQINQGEGEYADKWTQYVEEVIREAQNNLSDLRTPNQSKLLDKIDSQLKNLQNVSIDDVSSVDRTFNDLKKFDEEAESNARDSAPYIISSMFKAAPNLKELQPSQLEYYLKNEEGQFIHPNAIRYLLFRIQESFENQLNDLNGEIEAGKSKVKNRRRALTNSSSQDEEGSIDRFKKFSSSRFRRRKAEESLEEVIQDLKKYKKSIEEVEQKVIAKNVVEAGIQYIKGISDAYTTMYNRFASKILNLDDRIHSIEQKYKDQKGTTTLYVSADTKYLKEIFKDKPNMEGALQIGSELSELIFNTALDYSIDYEKEKAKAEENLEDLAYLAGVFDDLFDRRIVGYYEGIVERNYGPELDLNIIEAIVKENELNAQINRTEISSALTEAYLENRIDNARKLSAPFIDRPITKVFNPIYSCAFNPEIVPDKEDHSERAETIRKYLIDQGGESDKDIPKNEIFFYQSFYGLRANDLKKFAPADENEINPREAGEYHKAYYDRIRKIHPDSYQSNVVNPHISRWWHIITKMPDLDEKDQLRQEKEIYAAYFWTLIDRYVAQVFGQNGREVFQIDEARLGFPENELYISSGEDCRNISQVLDAIAIYPKLTHAILNKVQEKTQKDKARRNLEQGFLKQALESYSISEPEIGFKLEYPSHSVFDLPFLLQKIMSPQEFSEDVMKEIVIVEIEQIYNYLSALVSSKDLTAEMSKVLSDQLDKHLEFLKEEHKHNDKLYRETLFHKTSGVILKAFEEMDLEEEFRDYDQTITDLK